MAADRAFRFSGGAGSVHESPWIVGIYIRTWGPVARLRNQVFIRAIASGAAFPEADEFVSRDRQLGANRLKRVYELVLNDDRFSLAVFDDVTDLRPDEPEIDWYRDQAGECGRCINFKPLNAIVSEHGYAVAFIKANANQRVSQLAAALIPDAEGHLPF